jgi:dTDP-4-amino-4,6-dideoxygalactose transaminase
VKVPLLDLAAQHTPLHKELMAALERVVQSHRFILGPEVDALEAAVAARLSVAHALGVSSGTDALLLALMAMDIGPGDEVITSDYSFFATAGTIARTGATPVFVDIEPNSMNVDLTLVEAAITPKTRAFIPVHLFGLTVELPDSFRARLATQGIRIVEDAAQAIGARFNDGRCAGTLGDIGCFSFFPSKNLGALGDAGLVITNDDGLYEKMKALRVHGAAVKYRHEMIGGNFRIDAIQAAVLNVKLPHLTAWERSRAENAARYRSAFAAAGTRVVLPPNETRHTYNQFIIRSSRRDELRKNLLESGIETEVYYPLPFHQQRCFSFLSYSPGSFPQSALAATESLALPIAPGLTTDQIDFVVDTVTRFHS